MQGSANAPKAKLGQFPAKRRQPIYCTEHLLKNDRAVTIQSNEELLATTITSSRPDVNLTTVTLQML